MDQQESSKQQRQLSLQKWVQEQLLRLHETPDADAELSIVSGDASFRRYFRTRFRNQNYIAVDAPPEYEDSETFVQVDKLFAEAGANVPEVFATDFKQGFMLLQDFGDDILLNNLEQAQLSKDAKSSDAYYRNAIDALVSFQQHGDKNRLGPYDRQELHREMSLFEEWFCGALLNMKLNSDEKQLIADTLAFLEDSALSQHTVVVHRDYHSRNLMIVAGETSPGIIDFQDAVAGPYTYDLVSLLRDCYISWPQQQVVEWADYYLAQAQAAGITKSVTRQQFFRDFDLMGLQRNLKVMGIFSRLSLRDNKSRYLADIPLVIHYFMESSSRYSELSPFREWFQSRVLPLAKERLPIQES